MMTVCSDVWMSDADDRSLAMVEMTILVAAVYRRYTTSLVEPDTAAPGITSRFEVFHDITFNEVKVWEFACSRDYVLTTERSMNVGLNSRSRKG